MAVNRRRLYTEGRHKNVVDRMGTNVYSSKDHKSMHKSLNGEFILYQLLIEEIFDEHQTLIPGYNSLTEYFQPNDDDDKKVMVEFDKEYDPKKAIYWYTRESCIYKILNRSLRTQSIDGIIPFSSFIKDLNKQLDDEHKSFVKNQKSSSIKVYRGQIISKDEVNRLKSGKGELISVNSFLSTSTNKEKAIEFATSRSPPTDELTSILFDITIDLNNITKPYADIKQFSAYPDEEEILFMLGSIFRIENVDYDEKKKIWIGKLTLCSSNDSDIKNFSSELNNELHGQNRFISIGYYFIEMFQFDYAQEHFENILDGNLIKDDIDLAYCHHGLAKVNYKKGDYNIAISNINQSLKYLLDNQKFKNHPLISLCYHDLGLNYANQSNYILALEYLDKALGKKNQSYLSNIYLSLSDVHFKMKDYLIALEYAEKSLQYQSTRDYSLIASVYIKMGNIYSAMDDKDKSSEMFDKAINCQLKQLPSTHPDVALTYSA
ncbi:unnamed protein product, partial [Rotaria sordida]